MVGVFFVFGFGENGGVGMLGFWDVGICVMIIGE